MSRRLSILTLLAALMLIPQSQAGDPPGSSKDSGPSKEGTYLGVLFSSVPLPVYAQVSDKTLPRDRGVLVNFVLPNSPAAKAGIEQYDVLLRYDDTEITDCDQLASLISKDAPDHAVKLTYVRAGKERTAQAKLELGPALKVTQKDDHNTDVSKGSGKPAPGGVSLSVEPLEGGLFTVMVEYLDQKSGQLKSIPIERKTLNQVKDELENLPTNIKPFARSAWDKVRGRLEQKNDERK